MKLAVQLVVWNGQEYLPELFRSLASQDTKEWELLIWDNGSADHSLEIIEQHKHELGVSVKIFKTENNIGFAPAHDNLFAESDSDYILTLNQDVILEGNVLQSLVDHLEKNKKVASVAPRLMRMENNEKTYLIDSLGLMIERNRRVVDVKAGEAWNEEDYHEESKLSVFGVSAAVAMYRRSAVLVAGDSLFDKNYFAYQEDVDLAWRLQRFGYSSEILLSTIAWHGRTSRESVKRSIWSVVYNKMFKQSKLIRYHSYKNHLMTIYKNEQWQNFLIDFIWIAWYELGKLLYFLLLDPKVLLGLREIWVNRNYLFSERRRVNEKSQLSWRDMGKWLA